MLPWQVRWQRSLGIKSMDIDPDGGGAEIKARRRGIFFFILGLFGLGKSFTYQIDAQGWSATVKGPLSEKNSTTSWTHVNSVLLQANKPIRMLLLSLVVGAGSAAAFFVLSAILAIPEVAKLLKDLQLEQYLPIPLNMFPLVGLGIAFLLFLLFVVAPRRVVLALVTNGGIVTWLKVACNGKQLEQMRDLFAMMEDLILRKSEPVKNAPTPTRKPEPEPEEDEDLAPARRTPAPRGNAQATKVAQTRQATCPHCDAKLRVPTTAAGKRINCPHCKKGFVVK